jgi:hypothetical protein
VARKSSGKKGAKKDRGGPAPGGDRSVVYFMVGFAVLALLVILIFAAVSIPE